MKVPEQDSLLLYRTYCLLGTIYTSMLHDHRMTKVGQFAEAQFTEGPVYSESPQS